MKQKAIILLLALITTATAWADDQEGGWYFNIIGDHALITGLNLPTSITSITIPETLGGKKVTGFHVNFTFKEYKNLETIYFPANSSIPKIPTDFAWGCTSLENVTAEGNTSDTGNFLPSSITTIEAGAFAGTKIGQLSMPSVTAIGKGAFEGCNSLWNVTIGQAATIADDAFANINYTGQRFCVITYNGPLANWSYKAYRRSPNMVVFCTDGSCGWAGDTGTLNCVYWTKDLNYNVLYACDDTEAYSQQPTAQDRLNINWATKPDGTGDTDITSLTMRNVYTTGVWNAYETLQTVNLQEGVTAIDVQAFEGLTALTSVSMTADVTLIKSAAFLNCTSLAQL